MPTTLSISRPASLLLAAALLVACGDDTEPSDTASDTTVDAHDAVADAPDDADPDADPDAAPDVDDADGSDDAVEDAPTDATNDGSDDAEQDADDDTAEDVQPDVPRPEGYPTELPFEYTRPAAGEPPSDDEVAEFTEAITGFWRDSQYFRWVRMTSHGVDASNEEGWFHYALWWQDTQAIREGNTVTFRHIGRADNLTLRTCKVLTNAIAGYMMTGDENMRWIVEEYSRGLAALAMVMEFGEDDPAPYLQARAPFTRNHEFDTVGGRHVVIDYDPVRREEDAWNARIVHNPDNPHWGDVHFVNQRSKDDVPHMFRAVPMLTRAAEEAPDESVRQAATLALEYLQGFARDMVESGYQIRTKYEDGEPVVPTTEAGVIKDLASLVFFEGLLPNAECAAKLATAYVAEGLSLGNECGNGISPVYENVAATNHYFNYAIFRMFHVAAAHNAVMNWDLGRARVLLEGLAARGERMMTDTTMPHYGNTEWNADVAVYLLTIAAAGVPLTGDEARFVQAQYAASAEHYAAFGYWDPWAEGIEDGPFDYMPARGAAVRPTEIAYLLEYCYSPLRNPAGAPVVDCEVVADPARWGASE